MGQMIWEEGLFGSISLSGLQTRMTQELGMNSTSGGRPELVGGWEPHGSGRGGGTASALELHPPGSQDSWCLDILMGGGSSFQG